MLSISRFIYIIVSICVLSIMILDVGYAQSTSGMIKLSSKRDSEKKIYSKRICGKKGVRLSLATIGMAETSNAKKSTFVGVGELTDKFENKKVRVFAGCVSNEEKNQKSG